jgi:hypothetical protein
VQINDMEDIKRPIDDRDISKSWVNSSRFLFYVQVFCIVAFIAGCSFRLYKQRWKGKYEPEIQKSTMYNPVYENK